MTTNMDGKLLTRWARHICGSSVDDAAIDIQKEERLVLLDACLQHEVQHMNRKTMIKNLRSRIRKLVIEAKGLAAA